MMFPFVTKETTGEEEEFYSPREYEINFETGQITGKVAEGIEAIKVWVWLALNTPRYRYYIYSWAYGQEYEDLIGKGYTLGYASMELERMTEECLTVHPCIEGVENFICTMKEDKVEVSFTLLTTLGNTEVVASV